MNEKEVIPAPAATNTRHELFRDREPRQGHPFDSFNRAGKDAALKNILAREGRNRRIIRTAAGIVLSAAMAMTAAAPQAKAESRDSKPSIIYILADDTGYGDVGCYGQKEIATPNIDAMARKGMLFTDHYAGAPVCAPSRCCFLTGKSPGHADIRGNREILPEGQASLSTSEVTVAEVLKKAGYRTGIIGKWGLGAPGTQGEPRYHGFDYFFGYLCQRQAHSYYPDHLWRNGLRKDLDGKTYSHDLFTEDALRFITDNRDKAFFLYLAYTIPHAELQVPDLGRYRDKPWPMAKKKFAAMMTRLDRDIGRIMAHLKKLKKDKNTLIIFTSDNGPHAEGGADPAFFNSAGPFRGKKRDLYEGGIRIPMVAYWPGTVPAGRTSPHVSAFWDMLPTFAELAGAPLPEKIDGISMVPALRGRKKQQKKHGSLYWEFHEQGGKQALRMNRYKALRLGVRMNPDAPLELYDLISDPGENNNIAGQNPEITAKMARLMASSRSVSERFPLLGKMGYRPGLFHAWLFALPFFAAVMLTSLIGRGIHRWENLRVFKKSGPRGRIFLAGSSLLHGVLFAFTVWQPLWFGTWREDAGLVLCIIGLAGYLMARLHFLFSNPSAFPGGGVFRLSRNPAFLFTVIFWIGIAVSAASVHGLIILLALILINHGRILALEAYYQKVYGIPFEEYRQKTPRYLVLKE